MALTDDQLRQFAIDSYQNQELLPAEIPEGYSP